MNNKKKAIYGILIGLLVLIIIGMMSPSKTESSDKPDYRSVLLRNGINDLDITMDTLKLCMKHQGNDISGVKFYKDEIDFTESNKNVAIKLEPYEKFVYVDKIEDKKGDWTASSFIHKYQDIFTLFTNCSGYLKSHPEKMKATLGPVKPDRRELTLYPDNRKGLGITMDEMKACLNHQSNGRYEGVRFYKHGTNFSYKDRNNNDVSFFINNYKKYVYIKEIEIVGSKPNSGLDIKIGKSSKIRKFINGLTKGCNNGYMKKNFKKFSIK